MELKLNGKKAIVCASSRGLGKACAEELAKEGVEITINGTNKKNLNNTFNEFKDKNYKVQAVLGLLEEKDTQEKLLEKCPRPDI